MKTVLLFLLFALAGQLGFSQAAPCSVSNGINSGSVQVILYASPPGNCNITCQVGPVCVFPGQTVNVPPCGPKNWEWSIARVLPTTDDCQNFCTPLGQTIVSPVGCFVPPISSNFHCHAGAVYTADFISGGPNTLLLY